uniref:RING-type domain-containing protein n=1 Tax=Manihot esculenta TaxID=3983 RepID=A0A199U9V3_MANES
MAEKLEDIPDSFLCCICLDLLYKPIVLSCGHMSCFWCVHKSMNCLRESHCPICRHPYNHFPTICEMLHFLLLKMYPITYKRREEQILAEEKAIGYFSPQFDFSACGSNANQEHNPLKDTEHPSITSLESTSVSDSCFSSQQVPNGNFKMVSITDVQCTACKQLLFRPVVLNCGHGYCEACIMASVDKGLKCQMCQFLHPTTSPKVCLELDCFLERQFPKEYASRRDVVQLKQACMEIENQTDLPKEEHLQQGATPAELKIHFSVGCDYCGMYPIVGDRYQCKDCVEKIGFDLCGDCYNTRSKRPGRFNQQHTPQHRLERVKSSNFRHVLLRLVSDQFEDVSVGFTDYEDPSEVSENESPTSTLSPETHESTRNSSDTSVIQTESADDQNETESRS